MATIPKRVSDRLSKETRRFQRILRAAKDRDINEADTVAIIADMLADVFGFDKYTEITGEYAIRGTYCDLAVNVEGRVKYLIEVKAIGLDLKDTHLRQAVGYGAQHGIQWVILTNGVDWEIYRIKFDKPLGHELLTSFNYLDLSPRKKEVHELLFLLCKEGLSKAAIEGYHEHVRSVNKFVISAILQSEASLKLLRRELRRVAPGLRVETDEIQSILLSGVLKRDVLEGKAAQQASARVKKALGRSLKKRSHKRKAQPKEVIESEAPDPSEVGSPPDPSDFHPAAN